MRWALCFFAMTGIAFFANEVAANNGRTSYERFGGVNHAGRSCDQSQYQSSGGTLNTVSATCYDSNFNPHRQCTYKASVSGGNSFSINTYNHFREGEFEISEQSNAVIELPKKEVGRNNAVDSANSAMKTLCGITPLDSNTKVYREKRLSVDGRHCRYQESGPKGRPLESYRLTCYQDGHRNQCNLDISAPGGNTKPKTRAIAFEGSTVQVPYAAEPNPSQQGSTFKGVLRFSFHKYSDERPATTHQDHGLNESQNITIDRKDALKILTEQMIDKCGRALNEATGSRNAPSAAPPQGSDPNLHRRGGSANPHY